MNENDLLLRDIRDILDSMLDIQGRKPPSPIGDGNREEDGDRRSRGAKTTKTIGRIVRSFHGGIEDMMYTAARGTDQLAKMGGMFGTAAIVGAEMIAGFRSLLKITKHYQQMSDIGQTFNGSMLQMAAQAGAAGLSLDHYTKYLAKNSMATATIGVDAMTRFQKTVRGNMESLGFYGMSLDDVTDATSDYAETLRQTGMLTSMSNDERSKAFQNLIGETTSLSGAFGKSRKEMLATTEAAMRQTNFAASAKFGTKEQLAARQSLLAYYASQSKTLTESQSLQIGRGGYLDNSLGLAAQGVGMGSLNTLWGRQAQLAEQGVEMTPERMASVTASEFALFTPERIKQLNGLDHEGGPLQAQAHAMLTYYNEIAATNKKYLDENGQIDADKQKQMIADLAQAKKNAELQGRFTKLLLLLDDSFERIKGGFLNGFYGMLQAFDTPKNKNVEKFKEFVASLTDDMYKVGQGFGALVGVLMSPTAINIYGMFVDTLALAVHLLGKLVDIIGPIIKPVGDFFGLTPGSEANAGRQQYLEDGAIGAAGLYGLVKAFKVGRRVVASVPGLKKLLPGGGGGKMGDCCDSLTGGLRDINESIKAHAERSHQNATKTIETIEEHSAEKAAAKGGEKTAAHLGADALKDSEKAAAKLTGGLAEKAGMATAKVAAHVGSAGVKAVAKVLPFVGTAMGLFFAGQRAWQGDYVGAGLELAGAGASLIPGVGTAADAAIQGTLFTRDMVGPRKFDSAVGGLFSGPPTAPTDDAFATVKDSLAHFNAMKDALTKDIKNDFRRGDKAAWDSDNARLLSILDDIRKLTAQQTKMQKDKDDAAAAASYPGQTYAAGGAMM